MVHGHSPRARAASSLDRALARASGTWGGYQAWRKLDTQQRLDLVDEALGCSADRSIDCFPQAL